MQFFWREESLFLLLLTFAVGLVLLRALGEARAAVLNTLYFYLACLFAQFFSGLLHASKLEAVAAVVHEAALIGAGIALIRLCGLLVFRILLPRVRVTPPRIAEDMFVIIGYLAWGLVRLRYAGLDLSGILATSAMITAVLAFAMQDTLGNILGGLALQLDNSVAVGDWITVGEVTGRVVDIRWRSILVETRNWETVVIPSSQMMKNMFVVLGRRTDQPVQLRRWIWFNVSLDAVPSRVVKAVEQAVRGAEIANVAKTPQPNCVLMQIDKGCARYALRYWLTDLAVDDPTDAAVRWHVWSALARANIKLAVEEQSVHFVKENEKYEQALQQRELRQRVHMLHKLELFNQLTDDELRQLAERLKYVPFAKGDPIAHQGDASQHGLYILTRGEAEVSLRADNGEKRVLNVLGKGEFFGEMSLMTGAPRVADVLARTDVECYRLDKVAFESIMLARPEIAELVSHVLLKRRAELDAAAERLSTDGPPVAPPPHREELLAVIKRFFGL